MIIYIIIYKSTIIFISFIFDYIVLFLCKYYANITYYNNFILYVHKDCLNN